MILLPGYYDFNDDNNDGGANAETCFNQASGNADFMDYPTDESEFGAELNFSAANDSHRVERPPSYEEVIPPKKSSAVSMSQMPTLDLRGRRDRISEYDSEDSVEV